MEALPIIIVVGAFVFIGWLSQRGRKKAEDYRRELEARGEIVAPAPSQRRAKTQRRAEPVATAPLIPTLSIEEIAQAEADDLGLSDMPGAEDLAVNVQLLVYRRYEDIAKRCDGQLRYVVSAGVTPADATADEVQLVCDGELRSTPAENVPEPTTTIGDSEDDGNNTDL